MIFAVLIGITTLAVEPPPLAGELLSIKADALARIPNVEVSLASEKGPIKYRGIPLATILAQRANPVEGMPGLRDLSDAVLLVRGADGYQAAVSASAVMMDPQGERYFLALARDGETKPLQLIVPADPKHVRWVRDVVAVRLVRLRDLVPPEQ